jgi:nucleoside-diphosphate-sugar epimerase
LKDYLALYPVFNISPYNRNNTTKYIYESDVIIHLAGKAHDLKKVSSPDQYYKGNTDLTKQIFDAFLESNAKVFLTLSSVKAVADEVDGELNEKAIPNPITHYGKSKLKAEEYIFSHVIPEGKRVYVLRPCMIHGPGNKGNLNLLYSLVSKGLPWPLGSFENSRSFLSIENLCFSIKEFIDREGIPSGIYNIADDVPLSTNEVINIIAESKGKKAIIFNLNTTSIKFLSRLGDFLKLPLNSERLRKLTESYVVNNSKLVDALGKPFPISSKEGLFRTFQSFAKNV